MVSAGGMESEDLILEADQVYLLLKKNQRVSRNARAEWYFNNLNNVIMIPKSERADGFTSEIEVVSAIPIDPPLDWDWDTSHLYKYVVNTSTVVTFVSHTHCLVFCLDLSPSVAIVDACNPCVLFDEALSAFKKCIQGLVRPFIIPGSQLLFRPIILISVIACSPYFLPNGQEVIVAGWTLQEETLDQLFATVQSHLRDMEERLAVWTSVVEQQREEQREEAERFVGDLFESPTSSETKMEPVIELASPETAFVLMLRFGMLALQALPESTVSGIIFLTDGVAGTTDAASLELLLSQLRHNSVSCSFIRLGSSDLGASSPFGYLPNNYWMEFFATTTFGSALFSPPEVDGGYEYRMNVYQQAFLTWSFHKCTEWRNQLELGVAKWKRRQSFFSPILGTHRRKVTGSNLSSPLLSVLSCRLREGFTIAEVALHEDVMEIRLSLLWRPSIQVDYVLRGQWPLGQGASYEVFVEEPYDFWYDVTRKAQVFSYRQVLINTYLSLLKIISETDQLLTHLYSFSTNPAYYTVPEGIRSGVPLFYLPPNETSVVNATNDFAYPQFASFWKPVCVLDLSYWQRWLHSHRIRIVLGHDRPLPKYLYVSSATGRYHSVQCRQAMAALNTELRQSTNFVLLENHSYIGLLKNEHENVPSSFYLIRLTLKPPFVLLRIAFLGGTPGAIRHKVVTSLKDVIANLTIVQRGSDGDLLQRLSGRHMNGSFHGATIKGCQIFRKPLEQLLIRYEKTPPNIWSIQSRDASGSLTANFARNSRNFGPSAANRITQGSQWSTLRQYLICRRWIWCVQSSPDLPVSLNSVARILNLLSKLRMQEGFYFAHSYSGIVNMIMEVQMMTQAGDTNREAVDEATNAESADDTKLPSLIQYVIFPPRNSISNHKENSDEDAVDSSDSMESEGQLEIVTECWVEPQNGIVCDSPEQRHHFEGLTSMDLLEMFYNRDLDCISSLTTFEHLSLMCQNGEIPVDRFTFDNGKKPAEQPKDCGPFKDRSVVYVPFHFDLAALLPKCNKAKLSFSTFVQEYSIPVTYASSAADFANEKLFELLTNHLSELSHRELTLDDSTCLKLMNVLQQSPAAQSQRNDTEVNSTNTYTTPRGSCSTPRNPRDTSDATPQSRVAQLTPQALINRSVSSVLTPQCQSSGSGSSCNISTSKNNPSWRCFVKGISTSHVVVIILPATFQDLKLLAISDESLRSENPVGLKRVLPDDLRDAQTGELHADRLGYPEVTDCTSAVDEDGWSQRTGGSVSQPASLGPTRTNSLDVNRRPVMSSLSRVRTGSIDTPSVERIHTASIYNAAEITGLKARSRPESGESPSSTKTSLSTSAKFVTASSGQQTTQPPSGPNLTSAHASATLPVYIYDCPLSGLVCELLTQQTTLNEDIYRDHTFRIQLDLENNSTDTTEFKRSEEDEGRDEHTEEDQDYESRRILLKYCNLVETMYCKSLGQALFVSLQQGHMIHSRDVQAAMDLCKETLLEVDVTSFLQNICGHLKDFRAKSLVEYLQQQHQQQEDSTGFISLNQQFPLSLLRLHKPCSSLVHLHRIIKTRFEEILHLCFRPVPSQRDYYFYCPSDWQLESPNSEQHDNAICSFVTDQSIGFPRSHGGQSTVGTSSVSHTSSPSGEEDVDVEEDFEKDNSESSPLFLHLTTTLRYNKDIASQPINSLPTCLGDLVSCIPGSPSTIDLSGLKVTLDFLCLTFRTDEEIQSMVQGQQNMRTTSFCSSSSGQQQNVESYSEDEDENLVAEDDESKSSNPTAGLPFSRLLKHIPDVQSQDVRAAVAEIEWMIRDEIVAFLLDSVHIEESTLNLVVEHVQTSPHRPSCRKTVEPLYFVLHPDESFKQFVAEFHKISVPGYHLVQAGQYVYLAENYVSKSRKSLGSLNPPLGCSNRKTCDESDKNLASLVQSNLEDFFRMQSEEQKKVEIENVTVETTSAVSVTQKAETSTAELFVEETHFANSCEVKIAEEENVVQETEVRNPEDVVQEGNATGDYTKSCGGISEFKKRNESEQQSDASSTVRSILHTEDGYDGGSSASSDECEWLRDLDVRRPRMPPFWLVLKVCPNAVIFYFHCRYALAKPEELLSWKQTHEKLLENVKSLCKLVNQRMLLKDLHDTLTCNQLLEPESSDDIWHDDDNCFRKPASSGSLAVDDPDRDQPQGYLEAALKFEPGAFSCPLVWEHHFPLHPRLKGGPGKHGASKGVQQLSVVLSAFSVTNRNNMFVYQEDSGNVFYLRLHESFCAGHNSSSENASANRLNYDEPDGCVMSVGMSRKTSVSSAPDKDEEDSRRRYSYSGDKESLGDQTSLASLSISRSNPAGHPRREDCILLRVHGTTEASAAIKEDLVRALQNKLDDAVLELLHGHLSRNPSCKLTVDDVHFIQKPHEPPHFVFQFTLQTCALPYLPAVMFYLRQNLTQIVYSPKYMDTIQDHHFQDFSEHPAPETDIFLYNRPQGEGNRGIACVVVALVDGLGNPVKLEEWPRPGLFPQPEEIPGISELTEFTKTFPLEKLPPSPGPGPLAILSFKLWERGQVSIPTLKEKLELAISHSLWDVIMEYRLLCYPLCVPSSEDAGSCASLPCAGPNATASGEEEATEDARARSVSFSGLPPQRSSSSIASNGSTSQTSNNKIKLRHASSASHNYTNAPQSPVSMVQFRVGVPSSPSERSLPRASGVAASRGMRAELDKHETGDRGNLHAAYYKTIPEWLQLGLSKQVSSVKEEKFQHLALHTVPLVIKTVINIVTNTVPDNTLKIFACTGQSENPYRPSSSLSGYQKDVARVSAASDLPYILIGRSFNQWKESIQGELLTAENVSLALKLQKSSQKFLPHYNTENEFLLVPRQRFIWISIAGHQMTMLTYNCSKDTQEDLVRHCRTSVQWHAARWALLSSIAAQKLGLFHNQICAGRSNVPESLKQNPFVNNGIDVEAIIKQQAPPSSNINSSIKKSPGMFLEAYRDSKAPKISNQLGQNNLWDPASRHGFQWLEKRRLEKREELKGLRHLWQTRPSGSSLSVGDDLLTLFKQIARTIHYCLTPLLFLPKWRLQVASTRDPNLAILTPNHSQEPQRTRHDSGTSVQSNGKAASPSGSPPRLRRFTDDHWHQSLCAAYIQEYTQYLHTLGFLQLDIKAAATKRGPKSALKQHRSSDSDLRKMSVFQRPNLGAQENSVLYFHKSHQGGILICEVAIQEPFFYTKMHALEACRLLQLGSGHSPSSLAHYTDRFLTECDQIKVLLHLHSFTYDFHLRTLHSFVSGRHILLKPKFHVVSFLDDFTKYYNKAPNFARNQVVGLNLSIETRSTPGDKLFDYLLSHEKRYNFRVLPMITVLPDSGEKGTEYVLARQWSYKAFYPDATDSKQLDDYDVTLLVSHDPSAEGQSHSLQLKYYVILTSKRDLYPKIMMERKLGKFRTVSTTASQPPQKAASAPPPEIGGATNIPGASQTILERRESTPSFATSIGDSCSTMNDVFSTSNPETIPEESCAAAAAAAVASKQSSLRAPMLIRQEEINYLGYYTKHEQHMQNIVSDQAKSAEHQIRSVVAKAKVHCRRDTLWRRLQQTPQTAPLTYDELQELLELSHTELLSETEPQLCSLLAQPLSWYQGLAKLLLTKFPETHRNFVAQDGCTQQIVITNKLLPATAIMVSWDTRSEKAEVRTLYREAPPTESDMNQSDSSLTSRQIAMHDFVEEFVNLCCFHMWMGILS